MIAMMIDRLIEWLRGKRTGGITIADSEEPEYNEGALQLLADFEYRLFGEPDEGSVTLNGGQAPFAMKPPAGFAPCVNIVVNDPEAPHDADRSHS
jgi:hypothetical protein